MGLISYIYKFFSYLIKENIPAIKSVDLFFNQFESQNIGDSDGRANPRALIEIVELEPQQCFGKRQEFEAEIKLHIGIDIINTFGIGAELEDKKLKYLELLDDIYKKLSYTSSYILPEGIFSDVYSIYQIERSNILFSTNEESIKVTTVTFRCIIEDNSMVKQSITNEISTIQVDVDYKNDDTIEDTIYIGNIPN